MQAVFDGIDRVLEVLLLFNMSKLPGDDLDRALIKHQSAMQWMTLRGDSYATHGVELASALFAPHDSWLLETYGFTSADALSVGEAAAMLTEDRLNRVFQVVAEEGDAALDALGAKLVGSERTEMLRRIGMEWFKHNLVAATTCTPADVSERSEVPLVRVESVLKELSISVGSLERGRYEGLFDESPLTERPFLEHDGRYLLVLPSKVVRDSVALLERRLSVGTPGYKDSRHRTLCRLALDFLASMLPGATTHTHLYYDGGELDGLVLFDDVAIVVEGKGIPLSVPSKRGDVTRLAREIGEAVEHAWRQGARAREFLTGAGDAVFFDDRGNEALRVTRESISEVVIVNPTAHELGGHAPQLSNLTALGLFPEREFPWSVFVNDLRVISETCDNAAVFLHYLVWRARLPLGVLVEAHDELDVWGCYLMCERFGMLSDGSPVTIANSSIDFDAYYEGVMGRAPTMRRPGKFLTPPTKQFVDRMSSDRPPGWRAAAGACLDLSISEQALVAVEGKAVAAIAAREAALVWKHVGRVALVGLPGRVDEGEVRALDRELVDATLIIYTRLTGSGRVTIDRARYGRPVTFELSEFERLAAEAVARSEAS